MPNNHLGMYSLIMGAQNHACDLLAQHQLHPLVAEEFVLMPLDIDMKEVEEINTWTRVWPLTICAMKDGSLNPKNGLKLKCEKDILLIAVPCWYVVIQVVPFSMFQSCGNITILYHHYLSHVCCLRTDSAAINSNVMVFINWFPCPKALV